MTPILVGNPVSPYARKALLALELKGIAYQIDPISPFFGDERFGEISPLRRIPVLIEDDFSLCDSSVILQYLEDTRPEPSLLPTDLRERARARWIEEWADTRLGDVVIWKLFNEAVIRPAFWGADRDVEKIAAIASTDLVEVLDWLERQVPEHGFLFGERPTVADVAVAPFFANLAWGRIPYDAGRWPRTFAWLARMEAETPLGHLNDVAGQLMRSLPPQHRELLPELGMAVAARTFGTDRPRRGPMTPA